MHLAILNVFFAPHTYGGATIVAEEVGRRLVSDFNVKVSAISVMMRTDLAPYSVVRGEVDGISTWLINLPPGRSHLETFVNPHVAEQVARILHQIEPDLAHVHCVQDLGADSLSTLHAMGVPFVLSIHDFWWLCERQFMLRPDGRYCGQSPIDVERCRGCVDDLGRSRNRSAVLASLADRASVVTYPSVFARDLCESSGLAPGKGVVWENGVRLPGSNFFAAQKERRLADPTPVFGFVGGPSRIKGWPIIFDTFSNLERSDFRGIVVDGSLDGTWWANRRLDRLSGEWSVHPRYGQADMDAFYSKIDVLLFLSQWKETFGLTIREALARGIKVIQTDSGGTTEHSAVRQSELIKIGHGPEALRPHVLSVLDGDVQSTRPVKVTSQAEQAAAFMALADRVLGNRPGDQTNVLKGAA